MMARPVPSNPFLPMVGVGCHPEAIFSVGTISSACRRVCLLNSPRFPAKKTNSMRGLSATQRLLLGVSLRWVATGSAACVCTLATVARIPGGCQLVPHRYVELRRSNQGGPPSGENGGKWQVKMVTLYIYCMRFGLAQNRVAAFARMRVDGPGRKPRILANAATRFCVTLDRVQYNMLSPKILRNNTLTRRRFFPRTPSATRHRPVVRHGQLPAENLVANRPLSATHHFLTLVGTQEKLPPALLPSGCIRR